MIYVNTVKPIMPRSWCKAISNQAYDGDVTDLTTISISQLINPPKIRLLTARHSNEISVEVSDEGATLFGEAMHYVVSKAQDAGYIVEKRINIIKLNHIITGKPDLYDEIDRIIEDYKTASVWTYLLNVIKWEKQINGYAWLERTVKKREVDGLLAVVYFKDWKFSEYMRYDDYPERDTMPIPIKLWSNEEQEGYITERIATHIAWENLEDDEIPHCCKEERWADDDIYAVHKLDVKGNPSKRATNAQCTSEKEAKAVIKQLIKSNPKSKYVIQHRPAIDKRCTLKNYCKVKKFCNYWKERYGTRS